MDLLNSGVEIVGKKIIFDAGIFYIYTLLNIIMRKVILKWCK